MTSSLSSWIKVAQGFRLVANAAAKLTAEESSHVVSSVSRHGVDLAKNTRLAVANSTTGMMDANYNSDARKPLVKEQASTMVNSNGRNDIHFDGDHNIIDKNYDLIDKDNGRTENITKERNNISSSTSPLSIDSEIIDHSEDANAHNKYTQSINDDTKKTHTTTDHITHSTDQNQKQNNKIMEQYKTDQENQKTQFLKEGKSVPSTRIGRAAGFASLGVGLAAGTAIELASRVISNVTGNTQQKGESIVTNDANADRLARTLCRMRGAALKLGQMLSIQDETLLPPPLARALEQVRQGADAMPRYQLHGQLEQEFGTNWNEKFISFDELPFAAASIGQCHRATIKTGEGLERKENNVVVKCQYPGVANSIDSDLNNLSMLVKMTGMTPPGLFIDEVIRVGRNELLVECNYLLEAKSQERFRKLVEDDDELSAAKFKVPAVIHDLTTAQVLTSEFCPGGTIDKVAFLDQKERNRIAKNIMKLTMKELFVWRFMQTDPNWGNFLYDVGTGTTYLIDFGSSREYSKSFVDGYLRIVWASANQDSETLMAQSHIMGFLTGDENDIMLNAHKMSGYTVGEPFLNDEEYDFGRSGITGRLSEHGSHFLQHRLTPPPEEVYTLHRKLAGAYNLCIRLGATIKCRDLLEDIVENHVFEDGQDHPIHSKKQQMA